MLHSHHFTLPPNTFPITHIHHTHFKSFLPLTSLQKPTSPFPSFSSPPHSFSQWLLSQLPDPTTISTLIEEGGGSSGDGPIELPLDVPSIFSTSDNPSPLQVATSILLLGAISVFLFRSLRRRAKRFKELKFRSTGAKKSLKEEALDTLKVMGSASIEAKKPPSAAQALLGGISAGVIALILYKFTTTIEAALNRQTISNNFSVRQITITIRTIVNGLCYLATFVFGLNSVGLFLYSGQLALNSFMGDSTSEGSKKSGQFDQPNLTSENPDSNSELRSNEGDQNSEN